MLARKKKASIQAIATKRHIRIRSEKTGKVLKKATLIRLILHASRKRLGLKKGKHVGYHLRFHPKKKCRR